MLVRQWDYRPARSDWPPLRHLAAHIDECFLLGQRLQILFEADHPAPVHLFRVRQGRPHAFQLVFALLT
ncbi:hypothetical protein [Streptomyces canus]|uniref:hypothetical protein n=1 Tax=Streptomyces canus TaxID=58343 RepID=UPI002E339ACD|nr:hypothetical protein [Streptomyces canus]